MLHFTQMHQLWKVYTVGAKKFMYSVSIIRTYYAAYVEKLSSNYTQSTLQVCTLRKCTSVAYFMYS